MFTLDMREFFFARGMGGEPTMFHSRLIDGVWSAPREPFLYPGQARALAVDMAGSPDGREQFFLGNCRPPGATGVVNPGIWRSRRVSGAWTTAEMVPAPVSTDAREVYPTVVGDGSLSFTSNRPGSVGSATVYRHASLIGAKTSPVLRQARFLHAPSHPARQPGHRVVHVLALIAADNDTACSHLNVAFGIRTWTP